MKQTRKKRILQVGYDSFSKAGIQTVIMNIARGVHNDFDIDVLLTSDKPDYYDEEFSNYGNIYRVSCDTKGLGTIKKYYEFLKRPFRQFLYLRKLIKANRYDIVHIHSGEIGWPMFLAAKSVGVKNIIAHSHNKKSPKKRTFLINLYKYIGKKTIHFCASCKIGVSYDANRFLYGADESFIINNPVDIEKFSASKKSKSTEDIVITNVGRYDYQKNQTFIIEILNVLIQRGYRTKVNLVGFGDGKPEIVNCVEKYNLHENVNIIDGNSDINIPEILGISDIFVFPSRFEGLGIALIEAQAAGCLSLASDVVPRETDVGLCEYLSLEESADVWADKIIEMLKNKDHYAINWELLNQFNPAVIQKRYCELYSKM